MAAEQCAHTWLVFHEQFYFPLLQEPPFLCKILPGGLSPVSECP